MPFIQRILDYYCDSCGKTIKVGKKSKHLKNCKLDKCIRIKHTIEKPDFFEIEKIFKNYITNNKKKIDLYLV